MIPGHYYFRKLIFEMAGILCSPIVRCSLGISSNCYKFSMKNCTYRNHGSLNYPGLTMYKGTTAEGADVWHVRTPSHPLPGPLVTS